MFSRQAPPIQGQKEAAVRFYLRGFREPLHLPDRSETSVNATDFVVGGDVKYGIDGDKGKLKNTSGKEVKCTVVRVEKISAPKQ